MSNLRITESTMYAMEMMKEALAHPSISGRARNRVWRNVDITWSDSDTATITVSLHGWRSKITARYTTDYSRRPGAMIEVTILHKTWKFYGNVLHHKMHVTGGMISK